MNKKTMSASDLPAITGLIKDVVNLGMWFLYEVSYKPNPNVRYSLSTDKGEYLLSKSGEVLSPLPKGGEGDVEYIASVTFTGIPSAPVVNMPAI